MCAPEGNSEFCFPESLRSSEVVLYTIYINVIVNHIVCEKICQIIALRMPVF